MRNDLIKVRWDKGPRYGYMDLAVVLSESSYRSPSWIFCLFSYIASFRILPVTPHELLRLALCLIDKTFFFHNDISKTDLKLYT